MRTDSFSALNWQSLRAILWYLVAVRVTEGTVQYISDLIISKNNINNDFLKVFE